METIGAIGGVLFFIKLIIHIFLGFKLYKNFWVGASNALNPILFLPIKKESNSRFRLLITIANTLYFVSLALILFFLIIKIFKSTL